MNLKNRRSSLFRKEIQQLEKHLSETTPFLGDYLDDKGKSNIHFQQVAKISIYYAVAK